MHERERERESRVRTASYLHVCVHGCHSSHSGGGLWLADVRVAEQKLPAQVAFLDVIHVSHVHLACLTA